MKKVLLALALSVSLAGCSTTSILGGGTNPFTAITNPIGTPQLYDIENAYGALLVAAVQYRRLYDANPCPKGQHATTQNICAERRIVLAVQSADRKAHSAIVAARNFVKNNPTLSAASLLTAAAAAVNDFRNVAVVNGAIQ